MTIQNNLFGADDAPTPSEFNGDLVAQAKAQGSSPLQREFARLLGVIEKTAAQVQEMERLHGMYRAKFGQTLPPLKAQQDDLSRQMVVFLHERLQRPDTGKTKSLTASNRKAIGRLIVSLSMDFAMQGDSRMRAIHDLYSNETIDEMDEAGLDDVLDMLDQMGMEMPEILKKDGSKASAAEAAQAALRAIQEKMREQDEIEAQRKARRDEKRAAKAKADPKAQAKLAQKEQAAQDAQNALKNIYRQLARQLHPDRADNDTQRALNHDLMSEANTAYERQDLLALLKLQLKASQIDASAMSTVAEDKLKSWVALLRTQAKDLEMESAQLQMQMVHEFRVPPRQVISAAAIEQSLQAAVRDYDEVLNLMRSDLELVKNDADLKRWAKANSKDLERHDALLEDDLLDAMMMEQMMSAAPRRAKKKR
jgi:hypothetical protein